MTFRHFGCALALTATLLTASASFGPEAAQAQNRVEASLKGVFGLGLFGAELGLVIPALAGAEDTWPYIVFPIVGAAGGAVVGYFALEQQDQVELSIISLGVAMALAVPAVVITLVATAYDPDSDEDAVQSEAGDGEEAAPEEVEQSAVRRRLARATGGLLRVSSDELVLTIPALDVKAMFTPQELARYGGTQQTEVHVPLVSGVF